MVCRVYGFHVHGFRDLVKVVGAWEFERRITLYPA